MKTITVSNVKGGVAKTTTAATLAVGLNRQGRRVLLIDTDPQTNLTECFMDEPEDGELTLYHLYKGEKNIDELKRTIREGFDIVPGDFDLCMADLEFQAKTPAGFKVMRRALEQVKDQYDYAIFDTPPNLGILTLNALIASDYVISPMASEKFSLKAIRLLKRAIDAAHDENEVLEVIGILVTKYKERTILARYLNKNLLDAADLLDTTLFESRIREAEAIPQSQYISESIFDYAPKADVTKDYKAFVKEFMNRIGDEIEDEEEDTEADTTEVAEEAIERDGE